MWGIFHLRLSSCSKNVVIYLYMRGHRLISCYNNKNKIRQTLAATIVNINSGYDVVRREYFIRLTYFA